MSAERWDENGPSPFGMFVLFTDHLAELERVRAEERERTLRDAPASVFVKAFSDGRSSGYDNGRAEALREAHDEIQSLMPVTVGIADVDTWQKAIREALIVLRALPDYPKESE